MKASKKEDIFMKAILTVGVSASGKSQWAETFVQEHPDYINLNSDTIRQDFWYSLYDIPFSWHGWRRCIHLEKEVYRILKAKIADAIQKQQNVIISNTHLNKKTREWTVSQFQSAGYEVTLKLFDISFAEAVERDQERLYPVGYQVIAQQFIQWDKFVKQQYSSDPELPKAIIVDIDGTLTHINTKRSPFAWNLVGNDEPNPVVVDLVRRYSGDHCIVILTGREALAKDQTELWLKKHDIPFDILIMREISDNRRGDIVKEELFWSKIANSFNVVFAIEDTPKVVRMWQSINVPVFAIGNQYIEKSWQKPKL